MQGCEGREPETVLLLPGSLLPGSSATSRHRGGSSPEPMQVSP